ncbi:MAG: phosphoribosylanthranilate isomerase [Pseudomonadales bacterium]
MYRTRIKVCGLTRSTDAQLAVRAGADALGLVFYAASPRCVDIDTALAIVQGLPPFVATVALFVDPQAAEVVAVRDQLRPSLLQFHGAESAAFCEQFDVPYMKALHLPQSQADAGERERAVAALASQMQAHSAAAAFLLDTLSERGRGGTGEAFDHSLWPHDCRRPLVLAGGLHAGNVAAAIAACRPYAVDVSSGVESAPGRKDAMAIEKFTLAVQTAL